MNTSGTERGAVYSLHQLQGDKQHGVTRTGHLLKKSEGKMRRVWQKRRCRVQAEGFLDICHADETKPPTRVNLLTCQIKLVPDDKRCFDLISCEFDFFCIRVSLPKNHTREENVTDTVLNPFSATGRCIGFCSSGEKCREPIYRLKHRA
jgi:hypothetical protein